MHDSGQIISGGDVNIGAAGHLLQSVAEVNQTGRIETRADYRRGSSEPARRALGNRNWRPVLREIPTTLFLYLQEIIDPEFLVVIQGQFADHRAQRDLRRFHIHFVENLLNLHHHFAIAEHDDRVGPLIGDDLGVADRDRFRRRIDRVGRKFFGDVQGAVAAAAAAGAEVMLF